MCVLGGGGGTAVLLLQFCGLCLSCDWIKWRGRERFFLVLFTTFICFVFFLLYWRKGMRDVAASDLCSLAGGGGGGVREGRGGGVAVDKL